MRQNVRLSEDVTVDFLQPLSLEMKTIQRGGDLSTGPSDAPRSVVPRAASPVPNTWRKSHGSTSCEARRLRAETNMFASGNSRPKWSWLSEETGTCIALNTAPLYLCHSTSNRSTYCDATLQAIGRKRIHV